MEFIILRRFKLFYFFVSLARSLSFFLSIPFSTNFRSCSGRVFYLSLSSVCFLFFQFIQLKFSTRARSFILLLKIVFSFSLFQNREEWLEYTLFLKFYSFLWFTIANKRCTTGFSSNKNGAKKKFFFSSDFSCNLYVLMH